MLNISNHKGNANQNQNELSPHTCQDEYSQKDKKQKVLARMWRRNDHCWRDVNWHMEKSMEVPQNIKNRTIISSSSSTSGYFSEENRNTNLKRYMCPYVHCSNIDSSQDIKAT